MRLSQFDMVKRHVEERNHLLALIRMLDHPDALSIAIDGNRLDGAMVALAKPVITGELRARLRQLDADMARMGVCIDVEGGTPMPRRPINHHQV